MRNSPGPALRRITLLAVAVSVSVLLGSCRPAAEQEERAAVPSPIITLDTMTLSVGPGPTDHSSEFVSSVAGGDILVKLGYTANPFPGTNWNSNRDYANVVASFTSLVMMCGDAPVMPLKAELLGPHDVVRDITHKESRDRPQIWFRNDPEHGLHRDQAQLLYRFPPCGESGVVTVRVEATEEVTLRMNVYQERVQR
ncbi:hypothetical protein AMJ39_08585 [candidate division TA06 bacterium DG_24]|uniref:Lipoprotein n=3 Tax=Bacteria division TA06 TaxID=1156500 RepID=A0A0S8JNS1_UNCT6|nr:MAG: hypothetical protein AMJ39_08585 [candidate division TA06 bacterium DG_24]KPK68324.1 MAG: hypothetical protein AMJ82_08560 [candidate division TA06 bacterium SM23_40]KPL11375.1 MAG: hypothetical protein AMJ71_01010 [candidate division TA06 bacterium SM1_40]